MTIRVCLLLNSQYSLKNEKFTCLYVFNVGFFVSFRINDDSLCTNINSKTLNILLSIIFIITVYFFIPCFIDLSVNRFFEYDIFYKLVF